MKTLPRPTSEKAQQLQFLLERLPQANDTDHEQIMDKILELQSTYNWADEVFEENGKYGIRSCLGVQVVAPMFEDFKLLSGHPVKEEQMVVAMQNGKWGIIKAGNETEWHISAEFDDIGYPNALTSVRIGKKWGVLNTLENKLIIPIELDTVFNGSSFMFINGIGYFKKGDKLGVIDEYGTYTEAIFDEAEPDESGVITVRLNGESGFIDEQGKLTTDPDQAFFMETDI